MVARGKPSPAGIRGMLHNSDSIVLSMVFKNVGIGETNKVVVFAILEALQIFMDFFHSKLTRKNDSENVIH